MESLALCLLAVAGLPFPQLPAPISALPSLEELAVAACKFVTSLCRLGSLTLLTRLTIQGCPKIQSIPVLLSTVLRRLCISDCNTLHTLPHGIFDPPNLEAIWLDGLPKLNELPILTCASVLTELSFYGHAVANVPPSLANTTSLQWLQLVIDPTHTTDATAIADSMPLLSRLTCLQLYGLDRRAVCMIAGGLRQWTSLGFESEQLIDDENEQFPTIFLILSGISTIYAKVSNRVSTTIFIDSLMCRNSHFHDFDFSIDVLNHVSIRLSSFDSDFASNLFWLMKSGNFHLCCNLNHFLDWHINYIFHLLNFSFYQFFAVFQSHFSVNLKFESCCDFKFQSIFQFLTPTLSPIFECQRPTQEACPRRGGLITIVY